MRRLFWITLLGAALANLGCVVPSLHPLFTDNDLVFDPALIGPWEEGEESLWVFERSSGNSYQLILASEDEMSLFDAHLLQLGPHQFLDLYPQAASREDTLGGLHLLPVHTFCKLIWAGESLQLVPMNLGWLEEGIRSGSLELDHAWTDGELLLTAPTEELQSLVALHADDPAAFPENDPDSWAIELKPAVL